MSVCFFVPADTGATTSAEDNQDGDGGSEEAKAMDDTEQQLQQFWTKINDDIKKCNADTFKCQTLPLARIKKIMKLDEEVKMISAEAPVLFAKAAEIFIQEITLRAWSHTEDNKRRTLQRNDIAMAISKSDQFDFLIDIVPRHEVKPVKREERPAPVQNNTEQVTQQHTTTTVQQTPAQTPLVVPYAQLQQATSNATASGSGVQPVLLQQIVQQPTEMQQMPIQLTASQLNMIRLQMQNNPAQPIIIQAQQHQPQIIQVTSQAQQPQQQVYIAQVSNQQDD